MKRVGVLLLLVVASAVAAEAPQLPEVSKLRVLSAFKSGMLAQAEAQRAQNAFQAKAKAYSDLVEREIEANHLPKGTTLQVDADAESVMVILPKQSEEKKPAEPAKKPNAPPAK